MKRGIVVAFALVLAAGFLLGRMLDREQPAQESPPPLEGAGSVADHQDMVRFVFADGGQGQVLFLSAHLLTGDDLDILGNVVLSPFTLQGLTGSG